MKISTHWQCAKLGPVMWVESNQNTQAFVWISYVLKQGVGFERLRHGIELCPTQLHLVQPFLSLVFGTGGTGTEDIISVGPVTRSMTNQSPGDHCADHRRLISARLLACRSASWITLWCFIVDYSYTCHFYNRKKAVINFKRLTWKQNCQQYHFC